MPLQYQKSFLRYAVEYDDNPQRYISFLDSAIQTGGINTYLTRQLQRLRNVMTRRANIFKEFPLKANNIVL